MMALGGNNNDPNQDKQEQARKLALEADGIDMDSSPEYQMRKNVSGVLNFLSDDEKQNFHREFLLFMQDNRDISGLTAMEGQRNFVEARENLQEVQLEVQERLGGPERLKRFFDNLSQGLQDSRKNNEDFSEFLKDSASEYFGEEDPLTNEERKIISMKLLEAQLKYIKMAQLVTYHDWTYDAIMN